MRWESNGSLGVRKEKKGVHGSVGELCSPLGRAMLQALHGAFRLHEPAAWPVGEPPVARRCVPPHRPPAQPQPVNKLVHPEAIADGRLERRRQSTRPHLDAHEPWRCFKKPCEIGNARHPERGVLLAEVVLGVWRHPLRWQRCKRWWSHRRRRLLLLLLMMMMRPCLALASHLAKQATHCGSTDLGVGLRGARLSREALGCSRVGKGGIAQRGYQRVCGLLLTHRHAGRGTHVAR